MPPVSDHAFWLGVDGPTRAALVNHAELLVREPWPHLTARLWREFGLTGNRTKYQDAYFGRRSRLIAAVLAACLTDEPRWHDEVLDGVWLLCEETSWALPPHHPAGTILPDPERPLIDLFAAEIGALLAWTHAVLSERLAAIAQPAVDRMAEAVRARVLRPYRDIDTWFWLGRDGRPVGNWNTWINSNVLSCALLLADDKDALVATATKAVDSLDNFLSGYSADGGCDEGHMYWWRAGGSLCECLEFLRDASGGVLDAFEHPLIREIARYPHRVHIGGDWYVNVSDAPARSEPTHRTPHLLYRFGCRVSDAEVVAHARAMRGGGPLTELHSSLPRALLALADAEWAAEPSRGAPLVEHAWWPDTQLFVARERGGTESGLFVSTKGGHNAEHHNHNDVGSIIVAVDGQPVLVDAGFGEYSRTNSGQTRYSLWTHRSDYHNVPNINGCEQRAGRSYAARDVSAEHGSRRSEIRLDLAGAYPAEAGVRHWWRRVVLSRAPESSILLEESWEFERDPAAVLLRLLASGQPEQSPGLLRIPTFTRPLVVSYDDDVQVAVEPVATEDRRLRKIWGDFLWRITCTVRSPGRTGTSRLSLRVGAGGPGLV